METFDTVKTRVHRANPDLDIDTADFKTMVIEEVVILLGPSDTKIAKFTGYSRGFVIPRVKHLRKHPPKEITPTVVPCVVGSGRPRPQKATLSVPPKDAVDKIGAVRFF